MTLDTAEARALLKAGNLSKLFNTLGWDHFNTAITIPVAGDDYVLAGVAEKRGVQVFQCSPGPAGAIPDRDVRAKLDTQLRKSAHEHLIVFTGAGDPPAEQLWQWVELQPGKPRAIREQAYRANQSGEALLQKLDGIRFELAEEEQLTLAGDVIPRLREAFGRRDKVTKKFYDRFQKEHGAFLGFINGIAAQGDREWYASVMLNRLMFVYFIEKKGFLDGDPKYLRNRLSRVKRERGSGQFFSFYKGFLRRLFHEGLGSQSRSPELETLIGKVPYLNGGIFDEHQLETDNPGVDIPDEAFERIFDFFDDYDWHLDTRPNAADNEINPDVLGYIFEKYINQKQMGAYYTKEDITGYISRNTVLPFLLDATKDRCRVAFEPNGSVWRLLREDPDRYIYETVRYGVDEPLPPDITVGIEDVSRRGMWNRPAPAPFALPTETWREHVARRARCLELREKLTAGEVTSVNDLITLNLDIEQFSQDVIERSEGPDVVRAFYRALAGGDAQDDHPLSVLDPTCGSGAFLFAALNVLQPLYDACLDRMAAWLGDEERLGRAPGKEHTFRKVLAAVEAHPNREYFVLKSIIINNLYGVDIMEEAVEICKLRLFLKLVAQVGDVAQLEPLPDIDFNIRAGNTLVGFASLDDVKRAMTVMPNGQARMASAAEEAELRDIEESAELVDRAYRKFREQQTAYGGAVTGGDKAELRGRLAALDSRLDRHLAAQYGIAPENHAALNAWSASHQPFHWFVEFYGAMHDGGFDATIGNPPYVQRNSLATYRIRGFETDSCPDIYAPCVERAVSLTAAGGRFAMILPISFQFSQDFQSAREMAQRQLRPIWASTFSRNPAALFNAGLGVRSTICIGMRRRAVGDASQVLTTRLNRWTEEFRPALFDSLTFTPVPDVLLEFGWPRLDGSDLRDLFAILVPVGRLGARSAGTAALRFKTTALYYISAFVHDPPSFDEYGAPVGQTKVGSIRFATESERDLALLVALGKIALAWWSATGDDFDVTSSGIESTPVALASLPSATRSSLLELLPEIVRALDENIIYTKYAGKWMGNYDVKYVRELTDNVDRLILNGLGLGHYWEALELAYAHFMKATGERPGTLREIPRFSP